MEEELALKEIEKLINCGIEITRISNWRQYEYLKNKNVYPLFSYISINKKDENIMGVWVYSKDYKFVSENYKWMHCEE